MLLQTNVRSSRLGAMTHHHGSSFSWLGRTNGSKKLAWILGWTQESLSVVGTLYPSHGTRNYNIEINLDLDWEVYPKEFTSIWKMLQSLKSTSISKSNRIRFLCVCVFWFVFKWGKGKASRDKQNLPRGNWTSKRKQWLSVTGKGSCCVELISRRRYFVLELAQSWENTEFRGL